MEWNGAGLGLPVDWSIDQPNAPTGLSIDRESTGMQVGTILPHPTITSITTPSNPGRRIGSEEASAWLGSSLSAAGAGRRGHLAQRNLNSSADFSSLLWPPCHTPVPRSNPRPHERRRGTIGNDRFVAHSGGLRAFGLARPRGRSIDGRRRQPIPQISEAASIASVGRGTRPNQCLLNRPPHPTPPIHR